MFLVKREVVEERLKSYQVKNEYRKQRLRRLFEEAGCYGEYFSEQPVKSSSLPNVICTLPGATSSTIVVGAHFDKARTGHGVVDNWSGAALLPGLYESLGALLRRHTFVFVGFTDEERGRKGSQFYVAQLKPAQVRSIRAMVNLDSLGLSTAKTWGANPTLAEALAAVAKELGLPVETFEVEKVSTDSESFAKLGIPSITIHSTTPQTLSVLHSASDNLSALRLDEYYDTYRLIAAYLAYLDAKLGESCPE